MDNYLHIIYTISTVIKTMRVLFPLLTLLAFPVLGMNENNEYTLSMGKYANGKPGFFLNKKITPLVMDFVQWRNITETDIQQLKKDGFNVGYIAFDYPERNGFQLKRFLELCQKNKLPVVIEIGPWNFWKNWLPEHKSANMLMSTGESVQHYPDFVNPEVKTEWFRRVREMLEAMKPYYHKPIIAVSIGAHDSFQIPDGEVHALWVVPQHTKEHQTWLPYGKYVQQDFISFLKREQVTPEQIGFTNFNEIILPTDRDSSRTQRLWELWLDYRTNQYIRQWVKENADFMRNLSGLPVTTTYSPTWVIIKGDEGCATPSITTYSKIFDFLIFYFWGWREPALGNLQQQMQTCLGNQSATIPCISMLGFESGMGLRPIPVKNYLLETLPFVSGFAIYYQDEQYNTAQRYHEFIKMISLIQQNKYWSTQNTKELFAVNLQKGEN